MGDHPDLAPGACVIAMNFSLERVAFRSLGFKEGERQKSEQVRPGVIRSLVRGIAVAVATGEDMIDLTLTPVGIDRSLITVSINCKDEAELQIREDWLRTSLGTREARTRWSKGLEADLGRVGVCGSDGKMLSVRFNKGSKPIRTTPEGAKRLHLATIREATMGKNEKKAPEKKKEEKNNNNNIAEPVVVGKYRDNLIHDDHGEDCAFDNDGLNFAKALNKAHGAQRPKSEIAGGNREETASLTGSNGSKPKRKGAGKGDRRKVNSTPPMNL